MLSGVLIKKTLKIDGEIKGMEVAFGCAIMGFENGN